MGTRVESPYATLPVIVAAQIGRSTTSVTIEALSKTFQIQSGRVFRVGDTVLITSDADPTVDWMRGVVTAYAGASLTVDVQTVGGGGTHADWTIRREGPIGGTGVAGAPGTSRTVTVRVAAVSNVLSTAMKNGDVIDGVTLVTGDLILLTAQTSAANNGIYVAVASGSASRHPDFNTFAAHAGILVVVPEGSTTSGSGRGGTVWLCTSPRAGTLGTTAITFAQFGSPDARVVPHTPIVQDGTSVLIPALLYYDRPGVTATLAAPLDGSAYWEVANSTNTTTRSRFYFDIFKWLAGSNPITVATGTNLPLSDSWQRIELGHSLNQTFSAKWGLAVLGGRNRVGVVENQFREGNDPDRAPILAAESVVVDVADATLNGMGIYRGVQTTNEYALYGLTVPRTIGNEGIGCRFYVLADNDSASFDFTRAGLWAFIYGSLTTGPTAVVEKVISARLRIYSVFTRISTADISRWSIGIQKKLADTSVYTVCNAQFAQYRDSFISWIQRSDYDRVGVGRPRSRMPAPLMSKHLFLLEGRPVTFYAESIVPLREHRDFFASLSFIQNTDQALARSVSGKRALTIDPALVPMGESPAVLRTTTDDIPNDYAFEMPITVHKAAGTSHGGAAKVLVIGDSIPNLRTLQLTASRLASPIGVTINWVGSIRTSNVEGDPDDASGTWAECRRGRGLGGLVNCTSSATASTPLATGNEATYIAGNKATRIGYNPFLREAILPAEAAIAQSGWVFDFGNYLSRLSPIATVSMPDIVLITLFTNDWNNDNVATIQSNFAFAIPRILDSIFAAKSDMKVGFSVPGFAQGNYAQDRQQRWVPALAALLAAVNTYTVSDPDGLAVVVPTWSHMSPYDGWQLDTGVAVDAATGYRWAKIGPVSDGAGPFHPLGDARLQCAESWAAFIANVA